jgi:hypothetical protein
MIPPWVNGVATDVIAVGDLAAQVRPTLCGVSIGHPAVTAGTLGCLLRRCTRFAFFKDQIAISGVGGAFSDSGDSGALIVDAVTRRPIALLFGGGIDVTFASPIQPVLDRFGVEIL